ncbi:hypothetical protein LJR034_006608 [Caballeronia sp. LjRoot34]
MMATQPTMGLIVNSIAQDCAAAVFVSVYPVPFAGVALVVTKGDMRHC